MSYAVGYKLSLNGKIMQKTGMLILDTEPEGAKIYLNNKPRQLFFKKYLKAEESYVTTPAKIKNLLPGEYNVKLILDGYWEWQKKLKIKPGMSTFAEDINLFKKNLPLLLIDGNIKQISPSPNGKYLTTVSDKKIHLINLERETNIKELSSEISELSSLIFSPDSKKILLDHAIYDAGTLSEKLNLNNFIENGAIKSKWRGNDQIIYLSPNENNIKSFDLSAKTSQILTVGEKIVDFADKDDNIFVVNQLGKSTNLDIYESGVLKKIRSIELPSFSSYKFVNPKHHLINLYDGKRQILYLINPFSRFPLKEIINNVKNSYWINENKLLFANDFEIWLYNFNSDYSGQKILLTRISEQINNIIWHPSNNYIIYTADNSIYVIELDDREKRNTTELIKLDHVSSLHLDKEGKNLYFYAKIGNHEGLYKLNIQ